jgi:2-polyprenyl-6-methoxyphenol hydroxylase-like FAD-dependent oxidoreductase
MRIAVIGGGIGGLTEALALRQFGFEPRVFEQAPQLLDIGAAILIWPNATWADASLYAALSILDSPGQLPSPL